MVEPENPKFVEVDPSGRYGRYNEILGKGASKTVYRAFDEYEGIEVAWNQVRLRDFLQSPEELERLCSEIHLLKTLKHKNIMKFYTSWVDLAGRNINFITEMFTSGTLRQYRHKYRKVNIRAVKHWCRQILEGLLYLHSLDPPVIHRDLKCDNIFVNGNQGQVKIGDLGLAAVLCKSPAAHCVGTPEFMAPEVYEEQYNELVDVYSFGMCVLEMVTLEFPYSECTHPVQIYKKVTSGMKPEALFKVQDPQVRQFVEKCLVTAAERLPASELLKEPFLQIDGGDDPILPCETEGRFDRLRKQLSFSETEGRFDRLRKQLSFSCSSRNGFLQEESKVSQLEIELLECQEDSRSPCGHIAIKGKRIEDGSIFLRLRIEEKGGARNIYFNFDVEVDTALTVATEMVAQLEYLTNVDVMNIADMIDGELLSLIPEWRTGPGFEDSIQSTISPHGCIGDYVNSIKQNTLSLRNFRCSSVSSGHSRFHEDRHQFDETERQLSKEEVLHSLDIPVDGNGVCQQLYTESDADAGTSKRPHFFSFRKSGSTSALKSSTKRTMGRFICGSFRKESIDITAYSVDVFDEIDPDMENELSLLRSEYQKGVTVEQSNLVEGTGGSLSPTVVTNQVGSVKDGVGGSSSSCKPRQIGRHLLSSNKSSTSRSSRSQKSDSSRAHRRQTDVDNEVRSDEVRRRRNPFSLLVVKRFYEGILLRGCLPRKKSLKVDSVDSQLTM